MLGAALALSVHAEAQSYLVKDIAPGTAGSYPVGMLVGGAYVYFRADDGVHGGELWRSDGTPGATTLVKDIKPGPGSSNASPRAVIGGTIFFEADDGVHGFELWKSDGTAVGTILVKDIVPGPGSSEPWGLTVAGGTLFFEVGPDLWKSDGTESGTVLVKAGVAHGGTSASDMIEFSGTLFFVGSGFQLWKSDGTNAGTVAVTNMPSAFVQALSVVNSTLFFFNSGLSIDLWKSDGTQAGTVLVKAFPNWGGGFTPSQVVAAAGTAFFRAQDSGNGAQLWKTDGTPGGTILVKDLWPGETNYSPYSLTPLGGLLLFVGLDPQGERLWRSDGSTAGTFPISEVVGPQQLAAASGRLYFSAYAAASGHELWSSDGTAAGTGLLQDIAPGTASSIPQAFAAAGSRAFFAATDGGATGRELWALPLVPPPTASISDATQVEGNAGLSNVTFNVTLSATSGWNITVNYATADGTALAGIDYVATAGTLAFPPGATTRTVSVPIYGDRIFEPDEAFVVNLSGPVGGTILDGQGVGTITNDDVAGFSINDVVVPEGRISPTTATFTVTLSPTSGGQTSVHFATADGTATAASGDYNATSGDLTFVPGTPSLPVSVTVNPDALVEGAETFTVVLSNPQGGPGIAFSPGTATILDPQGGADFNGDGKTDIVFRHAVSGKNVVWFMDGVTRTLGVFTSPDQLSDTNWRIVGTNEFNADGKVDLLFRHAVSGKNVVWYMDGITRTAGVFTNPSALADTNWKMAGTGDFDTSGKPDILWRHGVSGKNAIWFMDGITRTGGVFTVPDALPDTNWQMVGVGDFSRDGKPDILWRHGVSGKNVVWFMGGVYRTAGLFTNPSQLPDTNWQMVAVGDFDSDEKPDILFRHAMSGKNVVWYMDGITRSSGVFTSPDQLPDTNWKIVGPK